MLINVPYYVFFQGHELVHNEPKGIIMSGQSLAIQKVKRHHAGYYKCSAQNSEGNATSKELKLTVQCKFHDTLFFNSFDTV